MKTEISLMQKGEKRESKAIREMQLFHLRNQRLQHTVHMHKEATVTLTELRAKFLDRLEFLKKIDNKHKITSDQYNEVAIFNKKNRIDLKEFEYMKHPLQETNDMLEYLKEDDLTGRLNTDRKNSILDKLNKYRQNHSVDRNNERVLTVPDIPRRSSRPISNTVLPNHGQRSYNVVDVKRLPKIPTQANVKNDKNMLANRKPWGGGAGILLKNKARIPSANSKNSNIFDQKNNDAKMKQEIVANYKSCLKSKQKMPINNSTNSENLNIESKMNADKKDDKKFERNSKMVIKSSPPQTQRDEDKKSAQSFDNNKKARHTSVENAPNNQSKKNLDLKRRLAYNAKNGNQKDYKISLKETEISIDNYDESFELKELLKLEKELMDRPISKTTSKKSARSNVHDEKKSYKSDNKNPKVNNINYKAGNIKEQFDNAYTKMLQEAGIEEIVHEALGTTPKNKTPKNKTPRIREKDVQEQKTISNISNINDLTQTNNKTANFQKEASELFNPTNSTENLKEQKKTVEFQNDIQEKKPKADKQVIKRNTFRKQPNEKETIVKAKDEIQGNHEYKMSDEYEGTVLMQELATYSEQKQLKIRKKLKHRGILPKDTPREAVEQEPEKVYADKDYLFSLDVPQQQFINENKNLGVNYIDHQQKERQDIAEKQAVIKAKQAYGFEINDTPRNFESETDESFYENYYASKDIQESNSNTKMNNNVIKTDEPSPDYVLNEEPQNKIKTVNSLESNYSKDFDTYADDFEPE